MKKIIFFCLFFLLLPAIIYAKASSLTRDEVISNTLDAIEGKNNQSFEQLLASVEENPYIIPTPPQKEEYVEPNVEPDNFLSGEKSNFQWIKFTDAYLAWGLQFGYISGNTSYDYDHHTSELKYPLDNPMLGTDLTYGFKNLSFNTQFWAPVAHKNDDYKMKDKDWIDGELVLETGSRSEMDAMIWDASMRYDFYSKVFPQNIKSLALLKSDEIKLGALLGYRYQRFDFDMYDLRYDTDLISGQQGQILNQGEKVLTYKIKYYLPYIGLGADVLRQNCGVSLNLKYAICPSAEDVDNHPLRGLTFYGDYNKDGNVFMGSMNVFWNLTKKWKFRVGADATLVRIDGKTWDETHDPIWDADQSIDTKQFIYWTGLEYKF